MTRIPRVIAVLTLTLVAGTAARAQNPARFDMQVRNDFFAGFAGDAASLARGMAACERALADNPKHAEALVWHGSGLYFQAGAAFQSGDNQAGMDLFARGVKEMDDAVALAPDNVGVLIPRGAVLLTGTRFMTAAMAKPLVEKALGDYEKTLALQSRSGVFTTLGDHPKGELLFGLAEGYARLGQTDKARTFFNQLVEVAPASGHAPQAKDYLATGELPKAQGLGCVGCHK
jgi:tetratricopeptide (TPR) repeat protein